MALRKTSAAYFSHDADASEDEKVMYLETLFGFMGYALYFKLLERLCRSEHFEMKFGPVQRQVLARHFGVTLEEFSRFIVAATSCDVAAFRLENDLLWSDGLKKRMAWLMEKRHRDAERIAQKRAENAEKKHNALINSDVAATSAQVKESKVKESKVKESKENNKNAHAKKSESDTDLNEEKKGPSPNSAGPLPAPSRLDEWIDSLTSDYQIKEGFCLGYKIPESLFHEYVQRFPAVARATPEKYYRRADLTGHFLNWSATQYAKHKDGPATNGKPPQRATIQHYQNDRPELYEKQKF